ncbi:unnamed protein product [Ambrosiozyma monospora]|uniref:Unnamed protein product n=1 Tax=Ambrosiozyma monospora TaxID=43982 RepID=A0A9W7DK76_AMBMO|nr:unnamed protein product [Ambrosiozyma monospora]
MKLYEEILERTPNYISAKLRWLLLSCTSENKVIKDEITELLERVDDDLDVRSFYGWYVKKFGKKHQISTDKSKDIESEHHRDTLNKHDSHDCYALVSLGNIYCSLAREIKDTTKKDQYYTRAAQLYQKTLTIDSHNAFAAQGVANIFADKKQSGLALEIYRKVRDAAHDVTTYLNLGHCLLEVKQFAKAIESYDIALNRFGNGSDSKFLNFLSRAWLLRGFSEKNLEYFKTSLDLIKKANDSNPIPTFKFNVAFVQFQIADFVRKLPPAKRTLEGLEKIVMDLEQAIKSLEELSENDRPPYPAGDLKLRVNAGHALTKQLEKIIQEQRDYEIEFQNKLKEAKKLKEEEEQKKLEAKLQEEEEKRLQEEKLAAQRRELEEKAKEWNQLRLEEEKDQRDQMDEDDVPKKKRGGGRKAGGGRRGRKKKEDFVVSGESSGESDSDLFGDEDDNDDSTNRRKRKKKQQETPKRRVLQKKSKLSKEVIDDSDEELSDDDDLFGDESEAEKSNNDNDDPMPDATADDEEPATAEPVHHNKKTAKIVDDEEDDE